MRREKQKASTNKLLTLHVALHFRCLPTELDSEQVQDYLYKLQQRSKTPSQTNFKHTVYGLRFLLKTKGLPYDYLKLPVIKRENKLPVILSRPEIWRMLQSATLLKHKLLISLLYGCGMRCMEVQNLELRHLDFDRKLVHIVQGKGNKDRYVPLSDHLIRGIVAYISAERPVKYLFSVKALSKVFRAKYVGLLRANEVTDQLLLDSLFSKSWVVYAKRPFGGPKQVIEYLGRYTHKVAISNHRIKAVTGSDTTFEYKDYRSGGIQKVMSQQY